MKMKYMKSWNAAFFALCPFWVLLFLVIFFGCHDVATCRAKLKPSSSACFAQNLRICTTSFSCIWAQPVSRFVQYFPLAVPQHLSDAHSLLYYAMWKKGGIISFNVVKRNWHPSRGYLVKMWTYQLFCHTTHWCYTWLVWLEGDCRAVIKCVVWLNNWLLQSLAKSLADDIVAKVFVHGRFRTF